MSAPSPDLFTVVEMLWSMCVYDLVASAGMKMAMHTGGRNSKAQTIHRETPNSLTFI
jgi:hypothetical protein